MKIGVQETFERLNNLAWEYRLGISTRGKGSVETSDEEHIYYGSVSYPTITSVLDRLNLAPHDVFVDLGCGKGRVVCCAAQRNVKEVIGIEYSKDLSDIAEKNSSKLRKRKAPINIVHSPVEDFDYAKGTVFYMFHPFGPATLQKVVSKLAAIHDRERRTLKMAYVWPMHESVLKQQRWLEELDRWEAHHPRSRGHHISFWKTRE